MSVHIDSLAATLDRSGQTPLYRQLKQWLGNCILSGELAPGARLPDELNMCGTLRVSRGVVRQALTELRYEGLVERRRGRGTFVSVPKTAEGLIGGLRGLADDAALRGEVVDSRILALRRVPATPPVARNLGLRTGEPVVELERLRFVGGEAHVLVSTYLPVTLVPGLLQRDLSGTVSLYRVLREDYGLMVLSSVRRVEAVLAGKREAALLGIRRGAPLLVLRSVGYTTGSRALDYFVALHRADSTAFEVELSAPLATTPRFSQVDIAHPGEVVR